MRPHTKFQAFLCALCALCASTVIVFPAIAGPLTPPAGPVAPTPGPEPRIALNAANTPGDADSVFRITAPGSYYLTGNLAVPLGKSGIEIAANSVTIDLMGYNIQAVLTAVKGISTDASHNNLTIRNGTVTGFPQGGIVIGTITDGVGALVEHIHVSGNAGGGIDVGNNAVVRHCTASSNGDNGIETGTGGTITDCATYLNTINGISTNTGGTVSNCSASNNGGNGISTGTACTVSNCSASNNADDGIRTSFGSTVSNCTAYSNDGAGILATFGSTVSNCTSYSNSGPGISASHGSTIEGCAARNNTLDGILCTAQCVIRGNTCSNNGNAGDGAGIHVLGDLNRIEGNTCTFADRGIDVDLASNIIIRNTCAGNTTNWVIVANNYYGPIIDRSGVVTAAVNGPAAAGTLATTDPNANFSY